MSAYKYFIAYTANVEKNYPLAVSYADKALLVDPNDQEVKANREALAKLTPKTDLKPVNTATSVVIGQDGSISTVGKDGSTTVITKEGKVTTVKDGVTTIIENGKVTTIGKDGKVVAPPAPPKTPAKTTTPPAKPATPAKQGTQKKK